MSRLADYFVVVGYDHGKERKLFYEFSWGCITILYLQEVE